MELEKDKLLSSESRKGVFADEFVRRVLEVGLTTYTKTDLQDLFVHCLNLASEQDFLNSSSNYEIANLLSVNEARATRTRMNIAQKFSREGGQEHLLRLFGKLSKGTTRTDYDPDAHVFEVGVENNLERRELETRAKQHGYTLNFRKNREIVVIPVQLFLEMVEDLMEGSDAEASAVYESFGTEIPRQVGAQDRKRRLETIGQAVASVTKDVLVGVATAVLQQVTR